VKKTGSGGTQELYTIVLKQKPPHHKGGSRCKMQNLIYALNPCAAGAANL
jgi:hypothetical protein